MNDLLTIAIDWLGKRPGVGAIMSGTGFLTGSIMADTLDIILKLFQIAAFGSSVFIAVLTAIGWFEKRKKNRP